jgi:AcrR family transcriptional regulator
MMAVKRPYDSRRRLRQAAQTKADILDAALHLFARQGYATTTIEAIADHAEVSEATVYANFGSKRGILAAFQERMHLAVDYDARQAELDAAAGDPAAQIAAGVRLSLSFPQHYGELLTVLLAARGVDPDIDAFLQQGLVDGHRGGWGHLASLLANHGALRTGLSEKEAGDLGAALTRIEIYRLLTIENGWTHQRVEEVITAALQRALLG